MEQQQIQIPLEEIPEEQRPTYTKLFGWAQRIALLNVEWGAITTSFMNCYALKKRQWWTNLNPSLSGPLVDLKFSLMELSFQLLPFLSPDQNDFFNGIHVSEGGNNLIEHFRERAKQIMVDHRGRGSPNPVLNDQDKGYFQSWYISVETLLGEVENYVYALQDIVSNSYN